MASTSMSTTAPSTATSSGSEKSSRRSTTISHRSKRSMASVIAIANTEAAAPGTAPAEPTQEPAAGAQGASLPERVGDGAAPRRRRFRRLRISPLTRRIVAVNVLPLALLALGFLYLGKFEASLIGQQIESLHTQGEIFAAALGEGAVLDSADEGQILLPDLSREMMRRLVEPTRTRSRLFDLDGKPLADSRLLRGTGDAVQVTELPPFENKGLVARLGDRVYEWIAEMLPRGQHY